MTTYVLDLSKWRCGRDAADPKVRLGEGDTMLLNRKGFMCCLGQFAAQQGVPSDELLGAESPFYLDHVYDPLFVEEETNHDYDDDELPELRNTELALHLMQCNDSQSTPVQEKINHIRKLLEQAGHKLEVINGHLLP